MSLIKPVGQVPTLLSKVEIEELAKVDIRSMIDNPDADLLEMLIHFRRYEAYLKTLIAEIQSPAIAQAKAIGKSVIEYGRASVTVRKRTTYNFSSDSTWSRLKSELAQSGERLKLHEELLKGLENQPIEILDESTGEMVMLHPPKARISTSTIVRL